MKITTRKIANGEITGGETPSQVWSPEQYQQFSSERLLPLLDLIKAIPNVPAPTPTITDLGAGTGAVVGPLLSRWHGAQLTLVDQSADMIANLRKQNFGAGIKIVEADIATWRPDQPQDLILSNAALHWVDDHQTLLPTLMDNLKLGGVLAIGVPNNWQQPSHFIMREIADHPRWAEHLMPLIRLAPLLSVGEYEDILGPLSTTLTIFERVYTHELNGPDPVAAWLMGSSLGPLLAALSDDEAADFYHRYTRATNDAYNPDGKKTLSFPFHRLFIIAQKY